jgi:hypothetical protein
VYVELWRMVSRRWHELGIALGLVGGEVMGEVKGDVRDLGVERLERGV